MNRHQKKCLALSTLGHVLILGGLLFSLGIQPVAEPPKPKPLQLASASRIESVLAAQQKKAEPIPQQQQEPEPKPEPVKPPPEPEPKPQPKPAPKPKPEVKSPVKPKPQPKKEKAPQETKPAPNPKKRVIQPNLQKVTRENPLTAQKTERKVTPKPQPDPNIQLQQKIQNQVQAMRQNLSGSSTIQVPETAGSPLDAERYARWVRERYENAWTQPEAAQRASSTVSVKVVVARDGTIISSKILTRSRDPLLDDSIQRALNLVKQLPRFPDGLQEQQMEFTINFNLKSR